MRLIAAHMPCLLVIIALIRYFRLRLIAAMATFPVRTNEPEHIAAVLSPVVHN